MSYKIVNRPAVRIDLLNAIDYYKAISPDLARKFLSRIREAREYILQYPIGFEVKYKNVRTVLLRQFPFHIHYLIEESTGEIIILAIINSYRNPDDYSGR